MNANPAPRANRPLCTTMFEQEDGMLEPLDDDVPTADEILRQVDADIAEAARQIAEE